MNSNTPNDPLADEFSFDALFGDTPPLTATAAENEPADAGDPDASSAFELEVADAPADIEAGEAMETFEGEPVEATDMQEHETPVSGPAASRQEAVVPAPELPAVEAAQAGDAPADDMGLIREMLARMDTQITVLSKSVLTLAERVELSEAPRADRALPPAREEREATEARAQEAAEVAVRESAAAASAEAEQAVVDARQTAASEAAESAAADADADAHRAAEAAAREEAETETITRQATEAAARAEAERQALAREAAEAAAREEAERQAVAHANAEAAAREEAERQAAAHAAAEAAAREEAERRVREISAREAAEAAARAAAESAAREEAERQAREAAAREAAEAAARDEIERQARESAAREAAESAARDAAARDEAERLASEAAAREAAESAARAAAEAAARDEAERQARESAARDAAESAAREAAELAARDEAERRTAASAAAETAARDEAERQAREHSSSQAAAREAAAAHQEAAADSEFADAGFEPLHDSPFGEAPGEPEPSFALPPNSPFAEQAAAPSQTKRPSPVVTAAADFIDEYTPGYADDGETTSLDDDSFAEASVPMPRPAASEPAAIDPGEPMDMLVRIAIVDPDTEADIQAKQVVQQVRTDAIADHETRTKGRKQKVKLEPLPFDALVTGTPLIGTIFSPSGGVGKSSTAMNLAVYVAAIADAMAKKRMQRGEQNVRVPRVLLLDGDVVQGSLALRLKGALTPNMHELIMYLDDRRDQGFEGPDRWPAYYDEAPEPEKSMRDFVMWPDVLPNLNLLAAPHEPDLFYDFGPEEYREMLQLLGRWYDVIIIDAGTEVIMESNRAWLQHANEVFLITAPEIDRVYNASKSARYIAKRRPHPQDTAETPELLAPLTPADRLSVVMTRYDTDSGLDVVALMDESFPWLTDRAEQKFWVPDVSKEMTRANNTSRFLVLEDPAYAKVIGKLAKHLFVRYATQKMRALPAAGPSQQQS